MGNSLLLQSCALDVRIPVPGKTYVRVGNDCVIGCKFIFESPEGEVIMGDRVFLGGGAIICRTKVVFGNDIVIDSGGYIYDHDSHSLDYRERQKDLRLQIEDYRNGKNFIASKDWSFVNSKAITIQDNAWIGENCTILKGVTIGEGAIVAAGSVVSHNVPPWTVVAGNPANVVELLPQHLRR
jgi:acetyltransferase-like isoleucine patch superfamily enzyme